MQSMQYHIRTFGCQMNHSDSEKIMTFLEKNGFRLADNITQADLIIFNTCGVRQAAEDRVFGQIHNLKKQETKNKKQATIVLTGCLANRKDVRKKLQDKVNFFLPIKEIENIISIIKSKTGKPSRKNNPNPNSSIQDPLSGREQISYLSIKPKYTTGFSAYVPIMNGCNNFCAYCVVPYARGRESSRPAEAIIQEIKSLIRDSYKEIILLGQNVNSYQSAENGKTVNFSHLVRKINALPGKFWIQFVSNHPKDVTDEMIETVARCKKVCESFHLPIQAGNDKVLFQMNRKYTAKQYLRLIKKIKAAYEKFKPGVPYAISSDIIVGFPGETKKQFLDSAKIMKEVKFDMVYFGQYSSRPGTIAWKMKDNVSKKEKARRKKYLNGILKKTALENNRKYLGKILEILIQKEKDGFCFGKTRTLKNIRIPLENKTLTGKFVKAEIIKANPWNIEGRIR